MRSYLNEVEWAAAFAEFGVMAPLAYADVCNTQLSIARHYGGMTVNGHSFYYLQQTDELVRSDVFKWLEKRRADALVARRRTQAAAAAARQAGLPYATTDKGAA